MKSIRKMKFSINRRRALTALISGMGGFVLPSRFAFGDQQTPYKRMFDDPLQFTGPDGSASGDQYCIGVFSPESGERSLLAGAQLAADEINQAKMLDKPLRLIQRWADGPWGAGSQQLIKMAYEDDVIAIIGGPDSASTHVAQQIALKAHLPLLAPAATDATLTEIRVPWIFRMPPSDDAMSAALMQSGCIKNNTRMGMIYADLHDARMAATAFRKALQTQNAPPLFDFIVPDEIGAMETAMQRAAQFSPDVIWVWFHQAHFKKFIKNAKRTNLCKRILTQWKTDDPVSINKSSGISITSAAPFWWDTGSIKIQKFTKKYSKFMNGSKPSYRDAFSYDAIKMIAETIKRGGNSRKQLRDAIVGLNGFEGLAGRYEWDNGNGNLLQPVVVRSGVY
ncbi:MAG: ABC transporter substrate-binding protein [Candidatus Hinthialibacter antarcticus]|nr:ABC transporter substrate-binding protein [Candidatus Hinthialibacter antarcticus]